MGGSITTIDEGLEHCCCIVKDAKGCTTYKDGWQDNRQAGL